jgi:murein DD-endopeptidase MepM/ murein hydrolase activator NlpD
MFAIDWCQLQGGRLWAGDLSANEQAFCFGADVLSVAPGTVVSVRDGLPDQTPGQPPAGLLQLADYAGNTVVVQIAPDVWATYAHLQPGSITVHVGDQVAAGQRLGALGNSGNSTGPHLHFQLSDGPDLATASSLPFVLDRYTLAGTVDPATVSDVTPPVGEDGADVEAGATGILAVQGMPQAQTGTYPLFFTVLDFP